jgi:hypothetical protein
MGLLDMRKRKIPHRLALVMWRWNDLILLKSAKKMSHACVDSLGLMDYHLKEI